MAKFLKEYWSYNKDKYVGLHVASNLHLRHVRDCSRFSNDKVERIDSRWIEDEKEWIHFQNTVTSVRQYIIANDNFIEGN